MIGATANDQQRTVASASTRIVAADMYFDMTADELCDPLLVGSRRQQPSPQACRVGSGETKLTEALPVFSLSVIADLRWWP
jgi:hypothetical protein